MPDAGPPGARSPTYPALHADSPEAVERVADERTGWAPPNSAMRSGRPLMILPTARPVLNLAKAHLIRPHLRRNPGVRCCARFTASTLPWTRSLRFRTTVGAGLEGHPGERAPPTSALALKRHVTKWERYETSLPTGRLAVFGGGSSGRTWPARYTRSATARPHVFTDLHPVSWAPFSPSPRRARHLLVKPALTIDAILAAHPRRRADG